MCIGFSTGDLQMHLQMIPAGVTCLETVTSIRDRWGQWVPAKLHKTLIQAKITLFGEFIKISAGIPVFKGLDGHPHPYRTIIVRGKSKFALTLLVLSGMGVDVASIAYIHDALLSFSEWKMSYKYTGKGCWGE